MVRERAAAERAHQARARPPPLPGQVPAAAGGGADPPPLPGGRPRARPVLRLGHDARGGRRPRTRRGGLRHLGLQRAALAGEDATARRRRSRCRAGRDTRARREPRGRGAGRRARLSGRVVRRGSAAGAARLSPGDRAGPPLERPRLARADSLGPLGATRPPRRARRSPHAGARALLVSQAPAHLRAHGRRAALPPPLLRRHRGPCRRLRRAAPGPRRGCGAPPRCPRAAPRAAGRRGRDLSALRGRDRLPRPARLRLCPARSRAPPARGDRQPQPWLRRARRRRLRRRHGGRADRVRRLPPPRRATRDRRQRPAGPVRRDPRARRPAARVAHAPARQPAHGTPRGRVLRGDPGRARAAEAIRTGLRVARAPRSRAAGS